ncbi:unnamed protein product [Coccothraustes coccothraustes]
MLALREAEHTNLKLPEAKRPSRAAFGRSRALESTATGTMLSARRSRFFASGSRTAWPLLRREERSAHNWHSSCSPQTHQGWCRALESTATGTMLRARRSRFFASGSRPSRPLLRREERSCT